MPLNPDPFTVVLAQHRCPVYQSYLDIKRISGEYAKHALVPLASASRNPGLALRVTSGDPSKSKSKRSKALRLVFQTRENQTPRERTLMKDEPPVTGTTTGQPQTARAREDEWIHTPIEDRYAAATRMAVDARYVRARLAASRTIALANTLADRDMLVTAPEGDLMWLLWDQPRTRQTFADPHPLDYPGGLPLPAEYVTAGSPPAPPQSAPTSHPAEQPPPTAHTA